MMRYLKMRFNAEEGMRNVNIEQQNNSYFFKIIQASFIVFINMIINSSIDLSSQHHIAS